MEEAARSNHFSKKISFRATIIFRYITCRHKNQKKKTEKKSNSRNTDIIVVTNMNTLNGFEFVTGNISGYFDQLD